MKHEIHDDQEMCQDVGCQCERFKLMKTDNACITQAKHANLKR